MQTFSPPPANTAESLPAARRPARRKRAPGQGDASSPDFVDALARGLSVLRCFTPGIKSLGNLELAERTGLAKSTVSRIVYTLTTLGYLRYNPETGRYAPGYGTLALGFGCLASLEVREVARPLMEALAQTTGGAVALGAFDGQSMAYIDAVHGSSALYLRLPVGYRASMDSTMGRTYLASLAQAEREALLPKLELPRGMPAIMRKACADFAAGGCCYGIGDWQPGINAAAAAFTAITGEGTFVLSCGGPDTILSESRLRGEVAAGLADMVSKLSLPGSR
ncbi:IclR family transcriptional regulator [Candidimonas nitroreducens]|uniref:IclR family transcriptional regulator n=1 Tax=Candidimonas nitroreducens TaxID=683354 RepID=A0A225MWY5_9BURK|nr:IclR family transcriptional regulator [Candidimonas nitroreducens]OWT65644.1 IclR family transcriptional regulator [Candidimonas nitroreducens]